MLYLQAPTAGDRRAVIDPLHSDLSAVFRPARWYRDHLARHFCEIGAGLFHPRRSAIRFYELEVAPRHRADQVCKGNSASATSARWSGTSLGGGSSNGSTTNFEAPASMKACDAPGQSGHADRDELRRVEVRAAPGDQSEQLRPGLADGVGDEHAEVLGVDRAVVLGRHLAR